jgi:hypothetical protein
VIAARLIVNGFLQFLAQIRGGVCLLPCGHLWKTSDGWSNEENTRDIPRSINHSFSWGASGKIGDRGQSDCEGMSFRTADCFSQNYGDERKPFFCPARERRAANFFSLFKMVLKNFLFFMPKRVVTVELTLHKGEVSDMNRYLEEYYREMEPLTYVPYFFWKKGRVKRAARRCFASLSEIRRLSKKNQITPDQRPL